MLGQPDAAAAEDEQQRKQTKNRELQKLLGSLGSTESFGECRQGIHHRLITVTGHGVQFLLAVEPRKAQESSEYCAVLEPHASCML